MYACAKRPRFLFRLLFSLFSSIFFEYFKVCSQFTYNNLLCPWNLLKKQFDWLIERILFYISAMGLWYLHLSLSCLPKKCLILLLSCIVLVPRTQVQFSGLTEIQIKKRPADWKFKSCSNTKVRRSLYLWFRIEEVQSWVFHFLLQVSPMGIRIIFLSRVMKKTKNAI